MIVSFTNQQVAALFDDQSVTRWRSIERQARRRLLYLNAASTLEQLRLPPGNHLEALRNDRKGQHSIRINDQWRICFRWDDGNAHEVEITDYH
ncbi:MAG: excinuclease ABC subunit A [Lysobacterales bacterium CG02_land_8_20_14_3_00_62_12]|nr:MAG: excinuclease ABC subunit A [Xanthomonadales bacterium CG02_land_8_20_14_3_00_62_12]PJA40520.1 MAG: excinuclease ABC subunit A [Xanthomonadales bacterium CG_4_9_14_3_um_filter_62_6]